MGLRFLIEGLFFFFFVLIVIPGKGMRRHWLRFCFCVLAAES